MPSLPSGFVAEISQYPQLNGLCEALLTPAETSIRQNPAKVSSLPLPEGAPVPWCPEGRYLTERPHFTFDPRMHQGCYYVQDASSMAITAAIRHLTDDTPVRYLDACAAPGGKTTAAMSVLPEGSVVVANEYDYRRAEILAENISKWGYQNVVVSRGNTSKLAKLTCLFDIVAVDAPCSGEGMMRKDPQAVAQWSESLISQCVTTQREILSNVWQSLAPGGYLIYSTCTFNVTENERNLAWIVDHLHGVPVSIPALDADESVIKGVEGSHPCYRFIPGRVRGEGLFMAVVKKPGAATPHPLKAKSAKPKISVPREWFDIDVEYRVVDNEVFAIPVQAAPFVDSVASKLDTILIGTHAATVKGRDVIPTHELALSQHLNKQAFTNHEVSYEDAIKYLQRDNITVADDTPKGYVLLTYGGVPLGFVKNLGQRTNSMLPKPWRILSHAPSV